MTTKTLHDLAIKARETRTVWLETHGVPISAEFADFAEAIGTLIEYCESVEECRRRMMVPPNPSYPDYNETHQESDWCRIAGCSPVKVVK